MTNKTTTTVAVKKEIVQIVGNIGRDAESRYTAKGKHVARTSVAVRTEGDEPKWYSAEAWEGTAAFMSDICKKGARVAMTGYLEEQSYRNKETGEEKKVKVFKTLWIDRCVATQHKKTA
jgi:single-stranded DNA-binding protein